MSTPNFCNQRNFKLYVQSFEPIDIEEYEAEYFADDEYNYPDSLEESYEDAMRVWEELFYDDLYNGADGFKGLMEEFNDTLTFHEIRFESGYYTGVQLYVEEKENPHELDNEDCHYYFDMCRSKAIRRYDAEIRKINKWMDKVATQYGWQELIRLGVFSNGEAIYSYAEKLRNAVRGVAEN